MSLSLLSLFLAPYHLLLSFSSLSFSPFLPLYFYLTFSLSPSLYSCASCFLLLSISTEEAHTALTTGSTMRYLRLTLRSRGDHPSCCMLSSDADTDSSAPLYFLHPPFHSCLTQLTPPPPLCLFLAGSSSHPPSRPPLAGETHILISTDLTIVPCRAAW